MTAQASKNADGSIKLDGTPCKVGSANQCMNGIAKYIDSHPEADIVALQEASCSTANSGNCLNTILNLSTQLKKMSYEIHNSAGENMTTFWNSSKFQKVGEVKSQFSSGRPYMILYLVDVVTKTNFAFINLHGPHSNQMNAFSKMITDNATKLTDPTLKRIIMSGDCNYDFNAAGITSPTLGPVKFNVSDVKKYTCCRHSTTGPVGYSQYDHVFDTQAPPTSATSGNLNIPGSDHEPILVELAPFSLAF